MSADSELLTQYEKFKNQGGFFALEKGVLKVSGKDACDFLHRMTTQDVKGLMAGQGVACAILQPNGMIISLFNLYNNGNSFLIAADEKILKSIAEHLEKFHFAETLEIVDVSEEFKFLSVQGSQSSVGLKGFIPHLPQSFHEIIGAEDCFVMCEPDFQTQGFHLLVKADQMERIKSELKSRGLELLSLELWRLLRFEAGFFDFGVDVTEKNLILEASAADRVSRNKGCYPGQEVVERVFTYGNVAKKLVGLEFSSAPVGQSPLKLLAQEKDAGVITSFRYFPWSGKYFGFGVVRKPHYEPGQKLSLEQDDVSAKIVSLPNAFDIRRELD